MGTAVRGTHKNGKTSDILVWDSQERWWQTKTLLSFLPNIHMIFGHIWNYLLAEREVYSSEILYLGSLRSLGRYQKRRFDFSFVQTSRSVNK